MGERLLDCRQVHNCVSWTGQWLSVFELNRDLPQKASLKFETTIPRFMRNLYYTVVVYLALHLTSSFMQLTTLKGRPNVSKSSEASRIKTVEHLTSSLINGPGKKDIGLSA